MCGRITLSANLTEILARFELTKTVPELEWKPLYNGAPGKQIPVVLSSSPDTLSVAKWGLLPSWAKDEKIGYKLINARAEGIAEKPAFRTAFQKGQRCWVVVDGFYEWKTLPNRKQPYRIKMADNKLFAMAGLWETYEKGPKPVITFSILTTTPNALLKTMHDRMPVILPRDREKDWLRPDLTTEQIQAFLIPYAGDNLQGYPVSIGVNNPTNNAPALLDEVQPLP